MSVEQEMTDYDTAAQLLNKGQFVDAAIALTDLLTRNDKLAIAWDSRGLALLQLGHAFDAIMNIERAVAIAPNVAAHYVNLGAAYVGHEQYDKGIAAYKKALSLKPDIAVVQMNLGNAYRYQGKLNEAREAYTKCVEIDPSYADGHLMRAVTELLVGNYETGWEEYEWRWKSNQLPPRGLPMERWRGESLDGKTLLIYSEQGHGDALQFIRYAPLVKKRFGGKVLVEVRHPLSRLARSMEGIDGILTYGEKVPTDIDYTIPMMSLPRIFATTVETIPWHGPYVKAEPLRAAMWHERLKAFAKSGLLVGVCWAGMSRPGRPMADAIDRVRSTTLEAFAPLAKVRGINWVSLQKGLPRDQVMKPPRDMTIGDWSDEFDDFYDTAALIENLDLVISVDTAVVHLAAAMGKPTWLLSRWDGCWRWLGNRSDSPWYPSLTQFVHPAPHAWDPMMQAVAVKLQQRVSMHGKKAA